MSTELEKKNAAQPEVQAVPDSGKPAKKEKEKKTLKQEILSWIYTLLAAIVIVVIIRAYFFEPIRVDGQSMANTLQDGDIVLVTKPEYWNGDYERGDVIICRYPDRNSSSSISLGGSLDITFTNHTLFVKRLLALPGDKVEIREGVFYINDEMVDETHIDMFSQSNMNLGPFVLGEDEYFVVGDNRGNSNDSRRIGPITSDMIVGHVRCVVYPFSNFGTVE